MKNLRNAMNKAQEPFYEIIQEPEVEERSELGRLWGIILDEKRLVAIVVGVFVLGGILIYKGRYPLRPNVQMILAEGNIDGHFLVTAPVGRNILFCIDVI